jgi:biotin operon repressor
MIDVMTAATGRRPEILTLLQARPGITAGALAARLGVTERTARRDVGPLRELGYRIEAHAGRARCLSQRKVRPMILVSRGQISPWSFSHCSATSCSVSPSRSTWPLSCIITSAVSFSLIGPRISAIAGYWSSVS